MSVASYFQPALAERPGRVTFEAYYEAEQRHEFIDGVVREMAGASEERILVVASLEEALRPRLRRAGIADIWAKTLRSRSQTLTSTPIPTG